MMINLLIKIFEMEDPEDRNNKDRLSTALEIENILAYSFVLVFASYMIVQFLILKKRHDIYYLSAYYALTVALSISKLSFFIGELTFTGEDIYQDYM